MKVGIEFESGNWLEIENVTSIQPLSNGTVTFLTSDDDRIRNYSEIIEIVPIEDEE